MNYFFIRFLLDDEEVFTVFIRVGVVGIELTSLDMEIIAGSIGGESVEFEFELVGGGGAGAVEFTGFEVDVSGGNEAKSVEFIEEDDDFFSLAPLPLLLFDDS